MIFRHRITALSFLHHRCLLWPVSSKSGAGFMAECSCGWTGEFAGDEGAAEAEAKAHLS